MLHLTFLFAAIGIYFAAIGIGRHVRMDGADEDERDYLFEASEDAFSVATVLFLLAAVCLVGALWGAAS